MRVLKLRLRAVLFVAIGILYVISIPWYRADSRTPELYFGFPDWVVVALACYLAVAVLNALAWLLTDIPDAGVDADADKRAATYASPLSSPAAHPATARDGQKNGRGAKAFPAAALRGQKDGRNAGALPAAARRGQKAGQGAKAPRAQ